MGWGWGNKYPGQGSLPTPPPPPVHPWKLGKLRSDKLFNHLQLKFLIHVHRHLNGSSTCFYLLFNFTGSRLGQKYGGQRNLLPSSEYLVNKFIVQNIILIFFKTNFHWIGHLNISILFLFLLTGWVGVRYPGLGSLPLGAEDTLAWAACPYPWKLAHSEKQFNHFQLRILVHIH